MSILRRIEAAAAVEGAKLAQQDRRVKERGRVGSVEGGVSDVVLEVGRRVDEEYIRRRLRLGHGDDARRGGAL